MATKVNYKPEVCECCGQTCTYMLGVDRGTVTIMKKIARAVEKKGLNCLHLAKEGVLGHSELCNVLRPRFHGLIAFVEGDEMRGNYCLTTKGLHFLRGERIPKYTIVSKKESRQIGYFEPEKYTVSITDFNVGDDYWEGIGYNIESGKVVPFERGPVDDF